MSSGHGQRIVRTLSRWTSKLKRRQEVEVSGPAIIRYLKFGRVEIIADPSTKITKRLTDEREKA